MPYATLPVGTSPMQNKTSAFIAFAVSGIDLYYWWSRSGGSANGVLKCTIEKPDGSLVGPKLAEDGNVALVLTTPNPQVKVLVLAADLTGLGAYKVFFEFKIDDGWVQAPVMTFTTVDDTTAG